MRGTGKEVREDDMEMREGKEMRGVGQGWERR